MSLEKWFGRGRGKGQGCGGNGRRRSHGRGRQRGKDVGQGCQPGSLGQPTEIQIGMEEIRSEPLQSVRRMIAMVEEAQCTGCGFCIEVCAEQAISVNPIAKINPDLCIGCGACIPACPNESLWLAQAPAKRGGVG